MIEELVSNEKWMGDYQLILTMKLLKTYTDDEIYINRVIRMFQVLKEKIYSLFPWLVLKQDS